MMNTELHPSYLEVAKLIVEGEHSPGTIYTHEWLREKLHIRLPLPDERLTSAEHQKLELAYCGAMDRLRGLLLEEHHIDIKSVPGKGYEVLSPNAQIEHGREKLESSVRKGIRASSALLVHVDLAGLDAASCAAQANALAKVGALSVLVRKQKFISNRAAPPLPKKGEPDGA